MKAPEKIYLTEDNPSKEWYRTKQVGFDSIEYTRTDSFIDKAEKYFTEKFIKDVSVLTGGPVHINFNAAISNFIKYMKGE